MYSSPNPWYGSELALYTAVQKRPELWNKQSPQYRKNISNSIAWLGVLKELNIDKVTTDYRKIREEWRKLKKRFNKKFPPNTDNNPLSTPKATNQLNASTLQQYLLLQASIGGKSGTTAAQSNASTNTTKVASAPTVATVNRQKPPSPTRSDSIPSKTASVSVSKANTVSDQTRVTEANKPTAKVNKRHSTEDGNGGGAERPEKRPRTQPSYDHCTLDQSKATDPDYLFAMQVYERLRGVTPVNRNKAQIEILKVFQDLY